METMETLETSITLRAATLEDAEALAALSDQLGYPATPAQLAHRLGLLRERPGNAVFVAETPDERVAGWVHVQGSYSLASDPNAQVAGLVVDEHLRGQGIGRALLARAERWAETQGYDELRLHSNVVREGSHGFYARLGYERVKASYLFRKTL
jgi:GNAT superfamily N-acetyltransferase